MTDKIKEFRYKQMKKDPYVAEVLKYIEKKKMNELKEEIRTLKNEKIMLSTEVKVLTEIIDRLKKA